MDMIKTETLMDALRDVHDLAYEANRRSIPLSMMKLKSTDDNAIVRLYNSCEYFQKYMLQIQEICKSTQEIS